MTTKIVYPIDDYFQVSFNSTLKEFFRKLKNTLRYLKGEALITHLGREYYE